MAVRVKRIAGEGKMMNAYRIETTTATAAKPGALKCPKCISPMIQVLYQGIEVDRCTDCQGLFFDKSEKEQLQALGGAGCIDIGDEEVGRDFNRVDRIFCPRCTGLMIRMVDMHQHPIWFEHCTVCGGTFFDAGEFRDLTHHTVLDLFLDLLMRRSR